MTEKCHSLKQIDYKIQIYQQEDFKILTKST